MCEKILDLNDEQSVQKLKAYLHSDKRDYFFLSYAPRHVVNDKRYFSEYTEFEERLLVKSVLDEKELYAHGYGLVPVRSLANGQETEIILKDVLFIPQSNVNVISQTCLTEMMFSFNNDKNYSYCRGYFDGKEVILARKILRSKGLFRIDLAGRNLDIFKENKENFSVAFYSISKK